ncbi:MAG TPA: trimeric intracellular cation channel family protein [Burkholderiales bacterium]|nr:trimeric intracellular cation channel family protein [Burkholderiales bacterium]
MDELLYWVGMAAVAVTAVTGVLEAGRKPIDLFGVVLVALTAALGGGTIRDLLLDRQVFWLADQTYLFAALFAGLATFLVVRVARLPPNLFLVPDAIGLALFTVIGTGIALAADVPWFPATFLGVVTGVFGGVLRDMLCNEVPLVFTGELYGTAAWTGALGFVALIRLGVGPALAGFVAMGLIIAIRLAAIQWRITLPRFVARR